MGKKCTCINSHLFPHREEKCILNKINPHKDQLSSSSTESSTSDLFETEAVFDVEQSQELANIYNQFFNAPWDETPLPDNDIPLANEVPVSPTIEHSGADAVPVYVVCEPCRSNEGPIRAEKRALVVGDDISQSAPIQPTVVTMRDDQCDCLAYPISKHRKSRCKWKDYAAAVTAIGITAGAIATTVIVASSKKK